MSVDTKAIRALGVVRVFSDLYDTEWKKDGAWMVTQCPFHDDDDPSFKVGARYPHRARCFSCDVRGDVIDLVARKEEIEPGAAMRKLAAHYQLDAGAPRPRAQRKTPKAEGPDRVDPAHSAVYRTALKCATLSGLAGLTPVREYLEGRGVYSAACAAQVDGIPLVAGVQAKNMRGFWDYLKAEHGPTLSASGMKAIYRLVAEGVGCLIFGTLDMTGAALAGLHVRVLGDVPHKLRYIQIGSHARPWRPGPLDAGEPVIICEGAIDALSWHAVGRQAIGLHGANTWRPWFAQALPEGIVPIVAMDRDDAGRRQAAIMARDLYAAGFAVEVVDLDVEGPPDANAALMADRDMLFDVFDTASPWAPDAAPPARPSPSSATVSDVASDPVAPSTDPRPEKPDIGAPAAEVDVHAFAELDDLIEWAHWAYSGKDGAPKREATVHPAHRLTDLVIAWIEQEAAGTFLRDANGGAWLYCRQRLLRIDTRDHDWRGWLYTIGRINLADREGKIIAAALEQYAQGRQDAPEPRCWLWYDRTPDVCALHLHDDADRIAIARAGVVEIQRNGSPRLLLRDDLTRPIPWPDTYSAAWALSAIDSLIVRNMATSKGERSLLMCWALTAFLRHRLDARALLFAGGAAGAGKTEAAKLITALLHGAPRVLQPTVAALWVEGAVQPIVALDNQESAQLQNDALRQWLIVAATGAERKKRAEGTQDGIISQRTDALAMVTAIEPPGLDELIQRTVTLTFLHELHTPGYSSGATVAELQAQRGPIIAGLLELLALHVIPRLREVRDYIGLIPTGHPKRRLADHLALCALIADAVHQVRPEMWGDGRAELGEWLRVQETAAGEMARGTDVLLDAFERLIHAWNRLGYERGLQSNVYRVAVDQDAFRCTPLYREPDGSVTDNERGSRRHPKNKAFGYVIGCVGSYRDLHADLLRACRDTSGGDAFKRRITNSQVLAARWGKNRAIESAGWRSELAGRHRHSGRTYRWIAPDLSRDTLAEGVTQGVTAGCHGKTE